MTLLLLLTSSNQDADVVASPGEATASATQPAPTLVMSAVPAMADAAGVSPSFIIDALVAAGAATASGTAPVASLDIQVVAALAQASATSPLQSVQVDTLAALATADGQPPVAIIHIQTGSGTAVASMAMPITSIDEDQDPDSGAAIAAAAAPVVIITLTAATGIASASAPAPGFAVASEPGAASATAGAGDHVVAKSITGRLAAARQYLASEQLIAVAELETARAANDKPAMDTAANRLSVLTQALSECDRAIVLDSQKYIVVPACSASASAPTPVVS